MDVKISESAYTSAFEDVKNMTSGPSLSVIADVAIYTIYIYIYVNHLKNKKATQF